MSFDVFGTFISVGAKPLGLTVAWINWRAA